MALLILADGEAKKAIEIAGDLYYEPTDKQASDCKEHYICYCRAKTLIDEIKRLREIIDQQQENIDEECA